jgi:hypothetical protein
LQYYYGNQHLIGRYIYKIKNKYLIDDYKKSLESINDIQSKNIVGIQRIRTNSLKFKSRWLIAQFFDIGFIPIDSIGYFTKKNDLDLKYLLIIINSWLMNLYYKLHYTDKNVKPIYLKELPIPNISKEQQQPFIEKANIMLDLNQKLQQSKQNFLNELEVDKISRKLQNFEELSFDEFIKEYKKAKKLKFKNKLEERKLKDKWRDLFEYDKKRVLELKEKIDKTDKEIDKMVYKLYGLSDDEVEVIEKI